MLYDKNTMKSLTLVSTIFCLFCSFSQAEPIAPSLKSDLVAVDGKNVKRFDDASLATIKHYAIYFSAQWCPPCRAFTPKLIAWYKTTKAAHPDFELIFVSSDQTEQAMEKYMLEAEMPWPALKFSKIDRNKTITNRAGSGIPSLVLLDAEGKILADSYVGENYRGPAEVMKDTDKILAVSASPAPAVP